LPWFLDTRGVDWEAKRAWASREHAQRTTAPFEGREDFRLAAIAGASWAGGLASLMLGDQAPGAEWLRRAAAEYETSWRAAPPGSWGRPIAVLRCRLMAGDDAGARAGAEAVLEEGALDASGPIGGYCGALALLVLGRDEEAAPLASRIVSEGLEPAAVGLALGALARGDETAFAEARRDVLRSFEEREAFLEDVRVADTVLVLDALAGSRGIACEPLRSPLLPGD
jgi:hypothetical protein